MNILDIRNGSTDINNQELFFSTLLKGLILKLNEDITIRGISVPHIVTHTGSDAMYLELKGYNFDIEPEQISNENYVYNIIPRCNIKLGGIDLIPDQLTNPYVTGKIQYEDEEGLYELVGEFRRMPVKTSINLEYRTDSFRDMLELIQQIITKLSFIRTFDITYMGQSIKCSYKIPESFSQEHMMEMDGTTMDDKSKKLTLDIEVEANLPVYNPQTIMLADKYITKYITNTHYGCNTGHTGDSDADIVNNKYVGGKIILKNIYEIN